jgi:hypothetical protein
MRHPDSPAPPKGPGLFCAPPFAPQSRLTKDGPMEKRNSSLNLRPAILIVSLLAPLTIFGCGARADDNATSTPRTPADQPPSDSTFNPDGSGSGDDDDFDAPATNAIEVDPLRFAVEVVDVAYGPGAGHGQDYFPGNVPGPPAGRGAIFPQTSPRKVLSLGDGGQITLRPGREIVDGPGPDLAVFENAFYVGGLHDHCMIETAFVEVSADGIDWRRFPADYNPAGPGDPPYAEPANFSGLAGVHPVYADPATGANPLDPAVSGGDFFDLATVGLAAARLVRIIDTGNEAAAPGTGSVDADGDPIDDLGNHQTPTEDRQGFDLDAIAVLNAGAVNP